jgi:pyrimidine oxygenase
MGFGVIPTLDRGLGTLIGSYANVARMLDEIATIAGTEGVLLTFDDFVKGVEAFGERIQPLMASRRHLATLPGDGRHVYRL